MKKEMFRKVISVSLITCMLSSSAAASGFAADNASSDYESTATGGSSESSWEDDENRADYMTEEQYADLGFSSLEDPAEFSEDDTSDPLEGYSASILSEIYIGQGNYGKDYAAEAIVMENASSYDSLEMETLKSDAFLSQSYVNDSDGTYSWQYQSSNTAAIKLGDLSNSGKSEYIKDSIVQYSIFIDKENDKASTAALVLYTLNDDNSQLVEQSITKIVLDSDSKFVQDIELQESGGYLGMTVGDFDGDNYNEVAVYAAISGAPQVMIYKQRESNGKVSLQLSSTIKLADLSSHYKKYDGRNRPLVSLSTTDISGSDDLVVCISMPYSGTEDFCYSGYATVIYSFDEGCTPSVAFKDSMAGYYDEDNDEKYRMKFTSSASMDINGDGTNELIIAANKNTDYKAGTDGHSKGDMVDDENLINIVLWDGSKYYLAWDTPQTVKALDFIRKDVERKEPISITGTAFDSVSAGETLFVEGVFYTFASGTGDTANEKIENGRFIKTAEFDSSTGGTNAFIHLAVSASFVEEDCLAEQTLVIYGDEKAANHDNISLDLFWCYYENGTIQIECTDNNYFDSMNEDDNGTFLTICPIDIDNDTVYYEYEYKVVGWSNPTVYSVLLSAPYWSELDYGTAQTARGSTTFTITTGSGSSTTGNWNIGLGAGVTVKLEGSVIGEGVAAGFGIDVAGQYVGSYQTSHTTSESLTFTAGGGEDYVALFAVPIVVYHYSVWVPEHEATEEEVENYKLVYGEDDENCPEVGDIIEGQFTEMCVNVQLDPAASCVPVSKYNQIIEEFNRTAEDEYKLDTIDTDEIYAGRIAGDPSTYQAEIKYGEVSSCDPNDDETVVADSYATVDLNAKSTITSSITESDSSTTSHGFTLSLKLSSSFSIQAGFDVGVLKATTTTTVSGYQAFGGGASWATTNSKGVTYTTTYASLPASAQTGTTSAGTAESAYSFTASMIKWYPDCLGGEIMVIGSLVSYSAGAPASLPEAFYVSGTTDTTATVKWTGVSNYSRNPSAYKLYYSTSSTGSYITVKENGQDVILDPEASEYTVEGLESGKTYYFKLRAYYDTSEEKSASVLGPYAYGTTKTSANESVITASPTDLYRAVGDDAVFNVEASPAESGDTLTYQWQQLSKVDYYRSDWSDILYASEDEFNAAYFAEDGLINTANAESLDKTVYRCRVTTEQNGSKSYSDVYSDSAVLYISVCDGEAHAFNQDGFCDCGEYEPAVLNSDGVYEISNPGQLYWFSALVNGDSTHAEDVAEAVPTANAILTADLDMDGIDGYIPIGYTDFDYSSSTLDYKGYEGVFDGNGHVISGLSASGEEADSLSTVGLFGTVSGTVKNLGVDGFSFTQGVNSDGRFGAIAGQVVPGGLIKSCFVINSSISVGTRICGAIAGCNYGGTIEDSYAYNCEISGNSRVGYLVGDNRNDTSTLIGTVRNCYSDSTLVGGHSGTVTGGEANVSGSRFESGEAAYLLNSGVTDGTQAWYQNIDNGKTPDPYPVFSGGTVYYISLSDSYSNTYRSNDEFDTDDNGNMMISSYDDLVRLAELVRSDYDLYGSGSYVLTKNIIAPSDSEWTYGIGSTEQPFNGAFDGEGYLIIGLNIASTEYGGLFEVIGENGTVRDLFVMDCDFNTSSEYAGGIAAINNGTIEYCISGLNYSTGVIYINDVSYDVSEYNSSVNGTVSGGIAAVNNGTIKGSRSSAVVYGNECGGIAGENNGTIYGCANNGTVGSSKSKICGGIAGTNNGSVENAYSSANVYTSSSGSLGSVIGVNNSSAVSDVFYVTVNKMSPIGSSSAVELDDSCVEVPRSSMRSDSFVDMLNGVSDDTVLWYRGEKLNSGYPMIKNNSLTYTALNAGNGITVSGFMHSALNIAYIGDYYDESLASAASGYSTVSYYSLVTSDGDSNTVPAELWSYGDMSISIPVSSENVILIGIGYDGEALTYTPESVTDGIATFIVSELMSFAIADLSEQTSSDVSGDDDNTDVSDDVSGGNDSTDVSSSSDDTVSQTGDFTQAYAAIILVIMLISAAVLTALRGRRDYSE